jgi:hypothetical protein
LTGGDAVSERLLRRWEALEPWRQGAIAFPVFGVLTFLLNLGPFNQALWRSIVYGVIEGGILTGLLLVATRTEKSKRGP